MSLIYKKGDILDATENLICHQVNVDGVMGGGLAKQIASRYPKCEKEYKQFCKMGENNYEILGGLFCLYRIEDKNQIIANCFTQEEDFITNYSDIKYCFKDLLLKCKRTSNCSIAVPYKYGCGIAKGDWDKVSEILENLSNIIGKDIVVYQLESGDKSDT